MKVFTTMLLTTAATLLFAGTEAAQAQVSSCCMSRQQCAMNTVASASSRGSQAEAAMSEAGMPMMVNMEAPSPSEAATGAALQAKEGSQAQEVKLEVTSLYSPEVLTVKKDVPVLLKVHRKDGNNCGGELLIPEFGVRQQLPAGQTTEVNFTPTKAGTFPFTCGMQMMKGQLVVQDPAK